MLRIILLDRAGRVLALEPPKQQVGPGADYSERDLFARVSSSTPTYLSDLYTTDNPACDCGNTAAATPVIGVSSFVADSQGARAGVVVAEVDVHLLGRALTAALGAADDIYVIDADGRLVMRASHAFTPDPDIGRDMRSSPAAAAASTLMSGNFRSPAYFASPLTKRASSARGSARPTHGRGGASTGVTTRAAARMGFRAGTRLRRRGRPSARRAGAPCARPA